ncbi:terminase gpA endonuclease subunit, partial [Escherichia coli]|uniref:terminase gpA endonuclease subunit n=1 Tax=Escherichia coli TaxID=562 RepID=UPI00386018F0
MTRNKYRRSDAPTIGDSRWAWVTGGIDAQGVYNRSLNLGPLWVIPIKGAGSYGQPVVNMPRTRNANKVYLSLIGTDKAKDLLAMRLQLEPSSKSATPGPRHFPNDAAIFSTTEAKQLVSEVLIPKPITGGVVRHWGHHGRRKAAPAARVSGQAAVR